MPQQAWSAKRERQYEHIKSGLTQRGDSEELAEEIAARTVNKDARGTGSPKPRAVARRRTSHRVVEAACVPIGVRAVGRETSCTRRQSAWGSGPIQDDQGTARAGGRSIGASR